MSMQALHDGGSPVLPTGPQWPPSPAADAAGPAPPPRIDSQQLLGTGHEVEISHAGAIYRLRRTALGKLILTK